MLAVIKKGEIVGSSSFDDDKMLAKLIESHSYVMLIDVLIVHMSKIQKN